MVRVALTANCQWVHRVDAEDREAPGSFKPRRTSTKLVVMSELTPVTTNF